VAEVVVAEGFTLSPEFEVSGVSAVSGFYVLAHSLEFPETAGLSILEALVFPFGMLRADTRQQGHKP
jgi:hypothetical protein